jgi:dipeptidyl aminopeptidase/acylaminoacyl peptidase
MPPVLARAARLALGAAALSAPAAAQQPTAAPAGGYRQPPAPIAQILDAEPLPAAGVSPDRRWLVQLRRRALPPISEVGAPELRLAGLRINPRTNAGSRDASFTGVTLLPLGGGAPRAVAVPGGGAPRLGPVLWSPDARRIAFTVHRGGPLALYVADVGGAGPITARRVGDVALNAAVAGSPCTWAGADRLACLTVPARRGPAPVASEAPTGPIAQESEGRAAPNPTFQDLLRSPDDERLFEHYATAQVAMVGVDGRVTPLGAPAVRTRAQPSPDGRWLLVETSHRPYSYLVPLGAFPSRAEVWDAATGRVARVVDDSPLDEQVSRRFDQVAPGPRNLGWRADAPATLAWVEALDGGDPAAKVAKHDALRSLAAPFAGAPVTHAELEYRGQNVVWARDTLALVTEGWRRTRRARTWAINPADPSRAPRLVFDRSSEDRYADPGRFETAPNAQGRPVLLTSRDGRFAYLTGAGASAEGDRPFVDRYELATGKTERLFRSAAPYYEEPVAVLDPDRAVVVTRRESVTEVPNYWRRALVTREAPVQLTRLADPAPQFAGVTSKLVTYKRRDGVELSATVYLPAGYDQKRDGPLPFFLWAYPLEFGSAAAASQVVGSPYRFTRPSGASHLFLLTQGYGVMDNPTMPIVARDGKEPNDTYVEQLVASAEAAVDQLVSMGVGDRERVAVGGHSYGAFMTANLLSHTKLFRAGIARSGAYNRTLTPFGFQGEERDYWKAQELYTAMSPFTYAHQMKTPLLLVHGMADDNQGTFPVQSERYYAALKGNGAKVRYVQLPAEAHGYRARESIGHTLAETVAWLDRWVKPKRAPAANAVQ